MGLGLITLAFLVCFSIHYAGKGMAAKPGWLSAATDWIAAHLEMLAFWGLVYSVVSFVLSPFVIWHNGTVLVALLSNALLFLMALPYTLDSLLNKYPDKVPAAVVSELKKAVAFVASREKVTGYAGGGLSFLLFVVLFR